MNNNNTFTKRWPNCIGSCKFNMSCEEIDNFYDQIEKCVCNGRDLGNVWNKFKLLKSSVLTNSDALNTDQLTKEFKIEFENRGKIEMKIDDKDLKKGKEPFVVCVSTLTNNFMITSPMLIKNYDLLDTGYVQFSHKNDFFLPSLTKCKIWEAARATSAVLYFLNQCIFLCQKV